MSDVNARTNITINGKLTVTIHLKDRPSRYGAPDLNVVIEVNYGASASEIEAEIDAQLLLLRRRLLIACGKMIIEG